MQPTSTQVANHHTQLVSALAALDHAPSALIQIRSYISHLEIDLSKLEERLKILAERTSKEKEEHESLKDSVGRRFAYTITGKKGKFEEKEKQEEREYVDALQEEMEMQARRDLCAKNLKDANDKRKQLEAEVDQYHNVRAQLDAIYKPIFSGPTPEHPEEDRAELAHQEALTAYNEIHALLDTERRAAEILANAEKVFAQAKEQMVQAVDASRADMYTRNSNVPDMIKRSALAQCQAHISNGEMLVSQARKIQPIIEAPPPVPISQKNVWSDIVFDTRSGNAKFHEQMMEASGRLDDAIKAVKDQAAGANLRVTELENRFNAAIGRLDAARKEFYGIRQWLYEQMLQGSQH